MTCNKWSPQLYESQHSFVWKYGADLIPLLDPQPGEHILDVGCGTGQLSAKIAESGAEVVGLDNSTEMIGQARQNYPRLTFLLADVTDFKTPRLFDAVFSNAALHWVRNAEAAVACISGALRPGGRFVAELGGKRNVRRLLEGVAGAMSSRGYSVENPWYFPSIGEYSAILERHEFEVSFAAHFDRMTPLEEGEDALAGWIDMFGEKLLRAAPACERSEILRDAAERLRPGLYRDGRWHIDYVRLRVAAIRQA